MITLRRAEERRHEQQRDRDVWYTFHPQGGAAATAEGFEVLEVLSEYRLPPAAGAPRLLNRDLEIVTYVREGALTHEDSMGRSGVIQAGEVQRRTAGSGIRHSESNASRSSWAHVFHVGLRPSKAGLEPGQEQKRFSAAERRGRLCLVTSPDARGGSLRIHQDALIFSAMLDPGQHVVHELPQRRSVWVQILYGEATLGGITLAAGDGAGVTIERAVSLTAREEAEILLLEIAESLPQPRARGGTV